MYKSFYGFKEAPFSLLPDPEFLYMSARHEIALSILEHGIANGSSITVVTGDIGTGKTTVLRQLLSRLSPDISVGVISNTHPNFGELLQWVMVAYGLDYKDKAKIDLYQNFIDFLIQQYAKNRRTVLVIDEAQNMNAATLEELRLLSNINAGKDQVLQLILLGQPELRNVLRGDNLVQFAQRVSMDYHLGPLSAAETAKYIDHRINVAGGKDGLFTAEAKAAVYQRSGGIPRVINGLCDLALLYGFAESRTEIDADLVRSAADDRARGGLFRDPQLKEGMG